jgi:hypothetical protein
MLEVAASLGLDAWGLEPGDAGCPMELKPRIVRCSLEESCDRPHPVFDILTMWHVLEHLREPSAAVRQLKDLLEAGRQPRHCSALLGRSSVSAWYSGWRNSGSGR